MGKFQQPVSIFFFGRITPCTTFQLENRTVQPSPVGPNISLWVANGHLHGNCYRPTCSGCRSPITTNGPFCSCNFGPFLMKHRSYEWQKKKNAEILHKSCFYLFWIIGFQFLKLLMPNMKILVRSIPTWITVFLIIHKVDLKFKTYPNNSMI